MKKSTLREILLVFGFSDMYYSWKLDSGIYLFDKTFEIENKHDCAETHVLFQ